MHFQLLQTTKFRLVRQTEKEERKRYLSWTEKIVYSRADAIVSGQYRNHYGEVAGLLAIIGEIRESMGMSGAKSDIFVQYKNKFPRHSSFQKEMKYYFNMCGCQNKKKGLTQ